MKRLRRLKSLTLNGVRRLKSLTRRLDLQIQVFRLPHVKSLERTASVDLRINRSAQVDNVIDFLEFSLAWKFGLVHRSYCEGTSSKKGHEMSWGHLLTLEGCVVWACLSGSSKRSPWLTKCLETQANHPWLWSTCNPEYLRHPTKKHRQGRNWQERQVQAEISSNPVGGQCPISNSKPHKHQKVTQHKSN